MEDIEDKVKFKEEVFEYRVSKDKKVFIFWYKKQVKVLTGIQSEKFLSRIQNADFQEAQLIMAKATGNFKRGNEKTAKTK